MAQDLLEASPTFASTVRRAAAAVAPLGVDLMAAFCNPNGWANGLEAAVGLTAVQIGLSDMLAQEHSLVPAGFLGHSAGAGTLL
jgi:fatty acid synthase